MAHTFTASNGTQFTHNGDFSGTVEILEPYNDEISVEFEDLKEFIAYYLSCKRTERLQEMTTNEILGI